MTRGFLVLALVASAECLVGRPALAPRPIVMAAAAAISAPAAELKVLYDARCMVCQTNKALLSFFDRKKRLEFVDIRQPDYAPAAHGGVSYEDAMRHIHVIEPPSKVVSGSEAALVAYQKVGLGWFVALLKLPLIRWCIDVLYKFVSANRYTISKWMPGGRALASAVDSVSDLSAGAMGEGCDDEEECMLDYDDDEAETV